MTECTTSTAAAGKINVDFSKRRRKGGAANKMKGENAGAVLPKTSGGINTLCVPAPTPPSFHEDAFLQYQQDMKER